MTRSIFLIAGEPSGDRLGAALMARLGALDPGLVFYGVGGPLMEDEGLVPVFPMEELSVMGLTEVLPRLPQLLKRKRETVAGVLAKKPLALVTIDSPDFCLRVAKEVKAANPLIRTIHYVAPSVWAWRAGRAEKMAKFIDHVLALLPFEPPLMHAAGMGCDFVGHPVAAEPRTSAADIARFRDAHGLGTAEVVLVLPGSRASEVRRLGPVFAQAMRGVLREMPETRIVLPAAGPVAGLVTEMIGTWPGPPIVLDPREVEPARFALTKRAAFAAADVALAASGTVSLELAAADTPMVIAYDTAPLTRWILGSMLKVDTVTLVNLVSETRAVPEFLGRDCRPQPIAAAVGHLLRDATAREPQIDAMDLTMERLGRGGEPPGLRAAKAVLSQIS
ncbi:lipid-A-disaccharide synthase [Rhodobacterales bacterium HKCCE2091]|nr:lipid-A-disaccharide synthase [Rhodobacterales bacterium HKCCE2091]